MAKNVNNRVMELVKKIKSRKPKKGSSSFLKEVRKQGIQFASGNGMSIEELTDLLKKTEKSRK